MASISKKTLRQVQLQNIRDANSSERRPEYNTTVDDGLDAYQTNKDI